MLVSHRKHFIYTKTSKTAGTSVEVYFEPYCMPEGEWEFTHAREAYIGESGIVGYRGKNAAGEKWYHHMSAELIREQLGPVLWSDYFKFCVIRNPFDRLVSAFYYEQAPQPELKSEKLHIKMMDWLGRDTNRALREQFQAWIEKRGLSDDRSKYMIDGRVCMDYFIRYEDLENGIRHVCQVLEIPFEPQKIPRLKTGTRPAGHSLRDYYSPKTIERVVKRYEFEFKHFGYPTQVP